MGSFIYQTHCEELNYGGDKMSEKIKCPKCGYKLSSDRYKCISCGFILNEDKYQRNQSEKETNKRIQESVQNSKGVIKKTFEGQINSYSTDEKIAYLLEKVQKIENRLPNSDIINPKFWTRAWSIFGHQLAIALSIYGTVFLMVTIISVVGR